MKVAELVQGSYAHIFQLPDNLTLRAQFPSEVI
jgi:hypothetical protein